MLTLVLLAITAALESIAGILCNVFIMIVSCWDKTAALSRSPANLIQFSMGLNNLLLQCMLTVNGFIFMFSPLTLTSRELGPVFLFLWYFFVILGFWLTAWLCSFYCVTIVSFKHKVITSLKMRLSNVVPKLLVATILGSFCFTAPSIWNIHAVTQQKITGNLTDNYTTTDLIVFNINMDYAIIFITLVCFLPLFITLTSIGFTLASLFRHVRRIQLSGSSLSGPQLAAHYRACRTMILLIIINVTFNVTEIIATSVTMSSENVLSFILLIVTSLYSTTQALVVISGSSKLKGGFCRCIPWIKQ